MKPAPKPAALRRHLAPRQKLWLNWDGVFLMGPNYLRFLAAVDKTGRFGRAAEPWAGAIAPASTASGGWSGCWVRQCSPPPGVAAPAAARLTPEARRLVKVFARWQREVERLTRKAFDEAVKR